MLDGAGQVRMFADIMKSQELLHGPHVDIDKVLTVYIGTDGKCACGCSGVHSIAAGKVQQAGDARGYAAGDDEVDMEAVRAVVRAINMADESAVDDGGDYKAVVVQGDVHIAYFDR